MPKVRSQDQDRASIFTRQKFITLRIVMLILFAINSVFPKHFDWSICSGTVEDGV